MTLLLDVNVLVAAIWTQHAFHQRANNALFGKSLATCPVSEMGYLRISTHRKALNAPMADARLLLEKFLQTNAVKFLPADLPVLKSNANTSEAVTDNYLADLAQHYGCKLATFDQGVAHTAVIVIA